MNLKDLFDKGENGVLSYDQFKQFASEVKAKFVDLSEGNYVSKSKYDDDILGKDNQINALNADIKKRDDDLAGLKSQLETAGNDVEKLNKVSSDLTDLQTKYQNDIAKYQAQLKAQEYEFAVKDFANSKVFTSNAAKRDFINEMVSKNLVMSEGKILGAEDFVSDYTKNNADAFAQTEPEQPKGSEDKPQFVGKTPGLQGQQNGNEFKFNFLGVRSRPEENK